VDRSPATSPTQRTPASEKYCRASVTASAPVGLRKGSSSTERAWADTRHRHTRSLVIHHTQPTCRNIRMFGWAPNCRRTQCVLYSSPPVPGVTATGGESSVRVLALRRCASVSSVNPAGLPGLDTSLIGYPRGDDGFSAHVRSGDGKERRCLWGAVVTSSVEAGDGDAHSAAASFTTAMCTPLP
jgi:hypothetical protein